MQKHTLKQLFSKQEITKQIEQTARQITKHYAGQEVVAVCVLKGACIFFTDLVQSLNLPLSLDFVRVASYGNGTQSGQLTFSKDLDTDITGKHVLLIEDIIDSGRTMDFLLKKLQERSPASLAMVALIDKEDRRAVNVHVDFAVFKLSGGFQVGYGLDYAEKYRELPALYELEFTE